ncbi:MAG: SpoIIE family protein phosphatase [Desulfobacterales bacterium]|nr:SpoIIE family protein phosphatase [Desulfobacterales bacterium]
MTQKIFQNQFRKNSIHRWLNLILIITTTVIFTGFAVFNYYTTKSEMDSELHRLTAFWAKQLSKSVGMPLWNFDIEGVDEVIISTMLEKQVCAVLVKDDIGDLLSGKTRDKDWNIINISEDISGDYVKIGDILFGSEKVGSVEVFLSPKFMKKKLEKETVKSVITVIILNISLVFVLYTSIRKTVILPVSRIAESVRVIASGNLNAAVHSERKDEIGQLASDVEKMRSAIKDLTENLEAKVKERTKELREARDALWGEMELAKKIQTVLLPEKPEMFGYDISASIEPADEVGGDYYDVISVGGYDWIVIGDVTGHGVSSGLVMMMVQTAIYTVLLENPEVLPSDLLAVINKTIYQNVEKMGESKHMTIVVLAGDSNGEFTFAGLHEDILIRRASSGKVEEIETSGMWIGLEPDISHFLKERSLKLEPGDCMVLFTDGITEAMDKHGDLYGNERLVDIVEEFGNDPASVIHNNIIDSLENYKKLDDVTLVVVKRLK